MNNIETKLETQYFDIYHVEQTDNDFNEYFKGHIVASNIDEAISKLQKDGWLNTELLEIDDDSLEIEYFDENEVFVKLNVEYFDNKTGDAIEAPEEYDEEKHSMITHQIRLVKGVLE